MADLLPVTRPHDPVAEWVTARDSAAIKSAELAAAAKAVVQLSPPTRSTGGRPTDLAQWAQVHAMQINPGMQTPPDAVVEALMEAGMNYIAAFAPGTPLVPFTPVGSRARQFNYTPGRNITTQPRTDGRLPFNTLQTIVGNYDVAMICVRHILADIRSMQLTFSAQDGVNDKVDDEIEAAKAFWRKPDKRRHFSTWVFAYLMDVLRYDAGALFREKSNYGELKALKVISGTTIAPMIDYWGDIPEAPAIAYTQFVEGLPWGWHDTEDIYYEPFWPLPESPYGQAPIETILLNANCFSADTEVLTRRGWLTFPEVDIATDDIATRNPKTQAFEWQQATKSHEAPCAEPMYHFTAKSVDMVVTAGHRMLVDRCPKGCPSAERWGDGWRIQAEELAAVPYSAGVRMFLTSEWDAPDLERFRLTSEHPNKKAFDEFRGDDFAAFMGMYLAEGCSAYEPGRRNDVWVSQLPESKGFDAYADLLARVLGRPCRHDGQKFIFHNSALAAYLKGFGGATEKFVPEEVLNLSRRQLEIFWKFYFLGDGCDRGSVPTITTSSKRMADGLQEIAQKIGHAASVRQLAPAPEGRTYKGRVIRENAPRWQVTLTQAKTRRFRVERVAYEGNVHCVSVPNRVIYVRRNGHALWCGQTDVRFQWHFLQMFTDGTMPFGFMEAPGDISDPTQMEEWQEWWDAIMAGDQSMLNKIRWVPQGAKFSAAKDPKWDEHFPEYLLNRTVSAYGLTPQALGFVEDVNRTTSEVQDDSDFRISTLPVVDHVQNMMDDITQNDLGLRVKCRLNTGREAEDRLAVAQANQIYVSMGALSPDEVREDTCGKPVNPQEMTPRFFADARLGPIPLGYIVATAGTIDPETGAPVPGTVLARELVLPGAMPAATPQPTVSTEDTVPEGMQPPAPAELVPPEQYQEGDVNNSDFDDADVPTNDTVSDYDDVAGATGSSSTGAKGQNVPGDPWNEMRTWQAAMRKRVKNGGAPRRGVRDRGPLADAVWGRLESARTISEVDAAFAAAKAEALPKAEGARPGPGGERAETLEEYFAPKIEAALDEMIDTKAIVAEWSSKHPAKKAAGDPDPASLTPPAAPTGSGAEDAQAEAEAASFVATLQINDEPMIDLVVDLYRASYVAGLQSGLGSVEENDPNALAERVVTEELRHLQDIVSRVNWDTWTPGSPDVAADFLDENSGRGFQQLLDRASVDIQGITQTTKDQIRDVLAEGIKNGSPMSTIADAIDEVRQNPVRSDMIARTEVARAMTVGQLDIYKATGNPKWVLIPSAGACLRCLAIAASNPHSTDDVVDQPPVHPRCRCSAAAAPRD